MRGGILLLWPSSNYYACTLLFSLLSTLSLSALSLLSLSLSQAMSLLSKFQFPSARWFSTMGVLSGGERRRLQLLQVLARQPNVLVLDEPVSPWVNGSFIEGSIAHIYIYVCVCMYKYVYICARMYSILMLCIRARDFLLSYMLLSVPLSLSALCYVV